MEKQSLLAKRLLFCQRRYSVLVLTARLLTFLCISVAAILVYFHHASRGAAPRTPYGGPLTVSAAYKAVCEAPLLKENFSEIVKLFGENREVTCPGEENWVAIRGGAFFVKEYAARRHPDMNCTLQGVKRKTDFKVLLETAKQRVENGTMLANDFYWVNCSASEGAIYRNYHSGTSPTGQQHETTSQGLDLDVVMIGVDSVSRMTWNRKLTKTREYFLNVLNGTEFETYNIVGDGTPAALLPILTGKREEELPEARRGSVNATSVDGFPWVWKNFSHSGYVTAWAEEQPEMGTFQLRLLGFHDQPVDHYYRPFTMAFKASTSTGTCLGSKPKSTALLEYIGDVFYAYPKSRRKWILGFLSELSHSTYDLLSQLDTEIADYIRRLHTEKLLDNALLIMFADHGARFQKLRDLEQGKLEERLPYFGLRFPKWFHQKYPDIIRNVQMNSKRLTSPFDVHETLLEVLHYTGSGPADISKRGVSLFKEIPVDRHCKDADIDPHWCVCLSWAPLPLNTPLRLRLQSELTKTLNQLTGDFREFCADLRIANITSMSIMQVKDDVLKFIKTNDGGRGRFGVMADSVSHTMAYYQVAFQTLPGGGKFEVTVTHDTVGDVISLEAKSISRINKYGNDSHCVHNIKPFLRPYCYCKDLLE